MIPSDAWILRSNRFELSAMKMLPAVSTATDCGLNNNALLAGPPSPDVPDVPNTPAMVWIVPTKSTIRMTWSPLSEMYTFPKASHATPYGVASDAQGNVYIADKSDHVIRMVDAFGFIHTVAGIFGSSGFSGDGGPASSAQLFSPQGVAIDTEGNIFIADSTNRLLREIQASDGIMVTLAGKGTDGDGKPSYGAQLSTPACVCASKDLLIADSGGHRIRRLSAPANLTKQSDPSASPANPLTVGDTVTFAWSVTSSTPVNYKWEFGDGSKDLSGASSVAYAYVAPGTYTATVTATDQTGQSLIGTVFVVVKLSAIVPDEIVTKISSLYSTDFMTILPNPGDTVNQFNGLTINTLAFNFNAANKDSMTLTLNMSLTETVDMQTKKCQRLVLDIGGIPKVFELKLNNKTPTDTSFTATSKEGLKTDTIKGLVLGGKKLQLTAALKNGTFATALQTSAGLQRDTNASVVSTTIPCSVLYGGHIYQKSAPITYTAKGGTGKGKGQ